MAIAGTDVQPEARGQLLGDPQSGSGVLIVSGLRPLEPGRVYQFWLIRGDSPVSAGVFHIDEQGAAIVNVSAGAAIGSYDAMGVSIEPEGGSAQPTGDIVMLASLS
jgi:anti-sigma-K factor RskA